MKNSIRDITCKEAEKSFNDLIDGYLNGRSRDELEHHIAHCRHCFGKLEFEKRLKEKIRRSIPSTNLAALRERIVTLLKQE